MSCPPQTGVPSCARGAAHITLCASVSLTHVHPSVWHTGLLGGILAGVQSLHQKVSPFGYSFPNRMLELYLFNLFFSKAEIISDPQPLPVPAYLPRACLALTASGCLELQPFGGYCWRGPADEATLMLLECRYTMPYFHWGEGRPRGLTQLKPLVPCFRKQLDSV